LASLRNSTHATVQTRFEKRFFFASVATVSSYIRQQIPASFRKKRLIFAFSSATEKLLTRYPFPQGISSPTHCRSRLRLVSLLSLLYE
jgi:hypothetical protein